MGRKWWLAGALLLLVAVWCGLLPALAAPTTVFVHNKPLTGKICNCGGITYVSAVDLFKAMGLKWTQDEAQVNLNDSTNPGGPALTGDNFTFQYMSASLNLPTHWEGGVLMVPLKQFAESMGRTFKYNPATGYADVYAVSAAATMARPTTSSATAAPSTSGTTSAPATAGAGSGATAASSGDQEEKEYIKADDPQYFQDWNTGEVRGTLTIRNVYKDTISNIKVILHIVDGYGNDIETRQWSVASLAANASQSFDFFWINPSRLEFKLKPELLYDKPVEPSPTPAPGKGK